jgi:hypothetical protein
MYILLYYDQLTVTFSAGCNSQSGSNCNHLLFNFDFLKFFFSYLNKNSYFINMSLSYFIYFTCSFHSLLIKYFRNVWPGYIVQKIDIDFNARKDLKFPDESNDYFDCVCRDFNVHISNFISVEVMT